MVKTSAGRSDRAAGGTGEAGVGRPLPLGMSFTVRRTQLLRDLFTRGRAAGIIIICAPTGFGKTALLLQCAEEVRGDPARGRIRMLDASKAGPEEVEALLADAAHELADAEQPFIGIDNMPALARDGARRIARRMRKLRERGFEIIMCCRPGSRNLLQLLGDSVKIGAQALIVHPREYAAWAHTFSISATLDVYRLTQGIPVLVASLQAAEEHAEGQVTMLDLAITELHGRVLAEMRDESEAIYALVCLMLLMGSGGIAELERCGVRANALELSRLIRDYPLFGFDPTSRTFSCVGEGRVALARTAERIATDRPDLVARAIRILLRAGRTDRAVALIDDFLDAEVAVEMINRFPMRLALAGHAPLITGALARNGARAAKLDAGVGAVLALLAAALISGDYPIARVACDGLRRRAHEIADEIDPADWAAARALVAGWCACTGIELPHLPGPFEEETASEDAALLRRHLRFQEQLLAGTIEPLVRLRGGPSGGPGGELSVPRFLVLSDLLLEQIATGAMDRLDEHDRALAALEPVMRKRKLAPLLARLRLAISARRLFAGLPVVDERAFENASTVAIRERDQGMQLLSIVLEGWASLMIGQIVNAEFRGAQVLKLVAPAQAALADWALLLERTAHITNTSRIAIREEAELLDLVRGDVTPAEAWASALLLSAARFDAELSAWYSLHRAELLEPGIRLFARLAMHALGDRADSMRRLIPAERAFRYALDTEGSQTRAEQLFDIANPMATQEVGQLSIRLLGGFKAERNGHILTDDLWRRRKTSVLVSRLALGMGSFVPRRTLTEELWPDFDYGHARKNLYCTLTALRHAMGQRRGGPQYIITQGEGVAINTEYVASDVARLSSLAREVLLRRSGISGQQILEMCLKIEQLYVGPLYVPDVGDPQHFVRMRRALCSKFLDCMVRGVEVALEDEDYASASWLIEAALRQDRSREDVVRCAMRVYDLCGRRREAVELYNSHLHYLEHELKTIPETQTRIAYERIVRQTREREII